MGGGEREGEGVSVTSTGSAAPIVIGGTGAVKPAPAADIAPAAPVAVASGGVGAVEKVKFTVSVRGHQWSSARHINETLQEFATAIERNARRLEFMREDDSIQRLQLAYGDGSEPEDLDVDATLGDVIICMGNKQLVAIVNSTRASTPSSYPPPRANGTSARLVEAPGSPTRIASFAGTTHLNKLNSRSSDPSAANGYNNDGAWHAECTTSAPRFTFPGPTNMPPGSAAPKAMEPGSRALRIAIPPQADATVAAAPQFQHSIDRACSAFHSDYMTSSSLPPLGPSRSNGRVPITGGFKPSHGTHGHNSRGYCLRATPSPAELANMLVRSSSHPPHRVGNMQPGGSVSAGHCNNYNNANNQSSVASPAPSGGFQSFTSALLSRLPALPNQTTLQCPHGASTNIALLAQFLASQLRAFAPVENSRGVAQPLSADHPVTRAASSVSAKEAMNTTNNGGGGDGYVPPSNVTNGQVSVSEKEGNHPHAVENGASPKNEVNNVKLSVSGSHEKDESSSSANVNAVANASTGDVVDSAHPIGRNELVFLVNRRSKTGVGTHYLKMSDLSTYFHLSVVDAAKKLGVSQTTLKKACRKFGLKRWPGRKVRSLESTIHGLEHTIAVGQGAGLEELTEAYMRNEVQKLQQEMDQLVHGTPQHSPAVRTADLYKRLYSRGWRSKYHNSGGHDVDLNTGNEENRPNSGLGPQLAKKSSETTRVANPAATKVPASSQTNQQPKQNPKGDLPVANQPTDAAPCSKQGSDVTVTKDVDIEGLLRDQPSKEVSQAGSLEGAAVPANVPVDNGAVVNCTVHSRNGEKGSPERVVVVEDQKEATFQERSPKRPKRECRTAAEAAVRQGLRSSTCAM